jgi:hypothetical protein
MHAGPVDRRTLGMLTNQLCPKEKSCSVGRQEYVCRHSFSKALSIKYIESRSDIVTDQSRELNNDTGRY